jgi:putative transposase
MSSFRKKNPRLRAYDYSSDGAYFITNSTDYSSSYIEGKVRQIVKKVLLDTSNRFSGCEVHYYSLMPTHAHVVLILKDCDKSVPEIWRVFKSKSTIEARRAGFKPKRLWQKNYYEHVVRNEEALERIVRYIRDNPFKEGLPLREIYGDRVPKLEV